MKTKDTHLIVLRTFSNKVLILTEEEFIRARKRGDSFLHNRHLKNKSISDLKPISVQEVEL